MSAEAIERVSLLAIAWERKVLVAKLVKSELKVYGRWSLEGAAIGLAWLDDQVLHHLLCLDIFGHFFVCVGVRLVFFHTSFCIASLL